jgi:hypothetical protein
MTHDSPLGSAERAAAGFAALVPWPGVNDAVSFATATIDLTAGIVADLSLGGFMRLLPLTSNTGKNAAKPFPFQLPLPPRFVEVLLLPYQDTLLALYF